MWTDRAYNKILPGVWHPAPRPEAAADMELLGLRCKGQQRKVLQRVRRQAPRTRPRGMGLHLRRKRHYGQVLPQLW